VGQLCGCARGVVVGKLQKQSAFLEKLRGYMRGVAVGCTLAARKLCGFEQERLHAFNGGALVGKVYGCDHCGWERCETLSSCVRYCIVL
jgi:hypothetical protein